MTTITLYVETSICLNIGLSTMIDMTNNPVVKVYNNLDI